LSKKGAESLKRGISKLNFLVDKKSIIIYAPFIAAKDEEIKYPDLYL
tara:strand:+ start:13435 stop:13575 length:141 start_codon:yes stop_codon:yes gene_type:complete